jgi:hypothetical protein
VNAELLQRLEAFAGDALSKAETMLKNPEPAEGWTSELRNLMSAVGVPIDKLLAIDKQRTEDRRVELDVQRAEMILGAFAAAVARLPEKQRPVGDLLVKHFAGELRLLGAHDDDPVRKAG